MGHEINIEIFVNKQLDAIQAQATSSRSKEHKELRDAYLLRGGDFGSPGSHLAIPFTAEVTDSLVSVLRSALAQNNAKIAEPALACLHKLVAYAYLQGETRPSGRLDDPTSLVTQVVIMTARAGASTNAAVQLAVVKTLLTLGTAEHFLCHGDTLMQAVRTVFNIAVGASAEDIKNTGRSALLQMLNTIVRRAAQQIITPGGTPMLSPIQRFTPRDYDDDDHSPPTTWTGTTVQPGGVPVPVLPLHAASASTSTSAAPSPYPSGRGTRTTGTGTIAAIDSTSGGTIDAGTGTVFSKESSLTLEHRSKLPKIRTTSVHSSPSDDQQTPTPTTDSGASTTTSAAASAAAQQQQHLEDTRTAQLASLAEQADLRALEKAMVAEPTQVATTNAGAGSASGVAALGASSSGGVRIPSLPPPHVTPRGEGATEGHRSPLRRVETPPDPRRALMKERRVAEWRRLTVPERDAIIVTNAMCKMAARETGIGAGETYMHVGKLLALEMLVRVFTNPAHDWSQIRREFSQQLRQPLCLALLRNCMSPYDAAVDAAVTILTAILASQRLREFMKSEIGALYPLLLLRPLEADRPESPHGVLAALKGLTAVCTSPQVLVDIFVNYDCNLQAANLFERTVKLLAKYVQLPMHGGPLPAAMVPKARAEALKGLLGAVKSMDTWAGPLKSFVDEGDADLGVEAGLGDGSGGTTVRHLHHEVLQKIQTSKAIKSGLEVGVETFNEDPVKGIKALVGSGALNPGAEAAADFLREMADRLDPAAVGELFGDHEEENITIMHAYIDAERFAGLSVDGALRRLLFNFRLPGEAQKIDRIMEKFAQKYCADNPGVFSTADAPYLLAFAMIMLNTDAHNPMAEARISPEDFVTMCVYQTEGGEYEQILPTEDLEQLYERIIQEEIAVRKAPSGTSFNVGGKGAKQDNPRRARLAAAVGLGQLAAPFWSGASWDKQHGVDVERQRLLELTGQLLVAGAAGNMPLVGPGAPGAATLGVWHAATHAEHARPMMQVCGSAVGKALGAALAEAGSLVEAAAVLQGYEQAVRLAALLRLEHLCESLVAGLGGAARLGSPAPPHTPEEARQVAALSKLISLGSCSEAGALGSAWVVLLRALSELEALKAALTPGADASLGIGSPTTAAAAAGTAPRPTTSPTNAAIGYATGGGVSSGASSSSSFLGRFFSKMGSESYPSSASIGPSTTVVSERSGRRGPLSIRAGPGMGAVLWAETSGAAPVDKIFTASTHLDGDAVLTFFRALAAVSQEELDPGIPGVSPRVYLLHRLVECAIANTDRIRMVWQRIWMVVSQHLVSAACHSDPYIAMFAVDALRQLADKLLCRAELIGFTAQGDALRPLTAVLRSSDSPPVRELAVACVAHAVGAQSRRIGSGWRAVIEALAVAASDPSPAVVAQSMDVMSVVFTALYADDAIDGAGAGHTCLRECMGAALAALANPAPAVGDLTSTALYMIQTLARRVDEASSGGDGISLTSRPASLRDIQSLIDAWVSILSPLAAVARADPRPREADTAAAVLLQILQTHGVSFPAELWPEVFNASVAPMLALKGVSPTGAAAAAIRGAILGPTSPTSENKNNFSSSSSSAPLARPTRTALTRRVTPSSMPLPHVSPDRLSPEGMTRVLRHAMTHFPDLWALLGSLPGPSTSSLLGPCLRLVRDYAQASDDEAVALGTRQLHTLLKVVGPRLDGQGWAEVESVVGGMVAVPSVLDSSTSGTAISTTQGTAEAAAAAAATAAAFRRQCRSSLLAMRCVGDLLQGSPGAMPAAVQLRLLTGLGEAVVAAAAVNADSVQRTAMARVLAGEEPHPAATTVALAHPNSTPPPRTRSSTTTSTNGNGSSTSTSEVIDRGYGGASPDAAAFANAARVEAGDWDKPVLPALLRHEVEGGRILLAALRRGATEPAVLDKDPDVVQALQKECESRVAVLALSIVKEAALQVGNKGNAAEDAVRAGLVRGALLALAELPAGAWQESRGEVFAQAAKLVCSSELGVRKAVQTLMRSQASAALAAKK